MKKFSRVLCLFLCLTLIAFVGIRPVQVSASVAATVAIGAYGVVKYVISSKVLVGLIIGSFSGFLLEPLLEETDSWYEESPVIRNWADQYNGVITGGEIVSVPDDVQSAIKQKFGVTDTFINLSTLYVPYDLTRLENVSAVHIWGQDVAAQLEANNVLVQQSNALLDEIKASLAIMSTEILTLTDYVQLLQTEASNIYKRVHNGLNDLRYQLSDLHGITHSDLTLIRTNLSNLHSMLHTDLTNVRVNLSDMYCMLSSNVDSVIGSINSVVSEVRALPSSLSGSLSEYLPRAENIDKVLNGLETLPNTLSETLSGSLAEYFPRSDVLTEPKIEVQVGTQTASQVITVTNYQTMGQAFSAKMGWIPQIFDFLSELRDRLYQSTAPKVKVHLSDAEGPYNWGDEAYILDMSWYAPYKASVDTILSGIMWLCFGWAVYKRIPDIISGVGLTVENATESRGHVWSDRAEREASLSYRQQRREDYYNKHGKH